MKVDTILGAGGSIGNALAKELTDQRKEIRLVSRSGFSWPGAKSVRADLSNLNETIEAAKGSSVVFLCVGLPLTFSVSQWGRNFQFGPRN